MIHSSFSSISNKMYPNLSTLFLSLLFLFVLWIPTSNTCSCWLFPQLFHTQFQKKLKQIFKQGNKARQPTNHIICLAQIKPKGRICASVKDSNIDLENIFLLLQNKQYYYRQTEKHFFLATSKVLTCCYQGFSTN